MTVSPIMEDSNSQKTRACWVALMREHVLLPDVDEETGKALFAHLADLGLWKPGAKDHWIWVARIQTPVSDDIQKRLQHLGTTESGFALKYFLPNPSASDVTERPADSGSVESSGDNRELLEQKTSNLSNLQIVRKYGRQMESFMELEKSFTEKLLGEHTSMKEARRIFNFVLGKMKQKEKPRAWEQLSRRRHK